MLIRMTMGLRRVADWQAELPSILEDEHEHEEEAGFLVRQSRDGSSSVMRSLRWLRLALGHVSQRTKWRYRTAPSFSA